MNIHYNQKTLKSFSNDLLADLELTLLDTLEVGVSKEWNRWLSLTDNGILEKAKDKAKKNERPIDFLIFKNFKHNLDFSDPVQLICSYSAHGNEYFKKYFKSAKEKNTLQMSMGLANKFRNLIYHHSAPPVYVPDIREFLKVGQFISNMLALSSLSIKYKKIEEDLDNSIMASNHFIKDSVDTIYNNLPKPDYDDWDGLVGRNEIKQRIIEDFQKGYNRIIALTGGGGVGKTALALNISLEFAKPMNFLFKHIIWITSKNNFLDYSGINHLKPDYFYSNNYKDFLNQFISGFYQELFVTNLESVTEAELEKEVMDIFKSYNRILCVVDNLENIDDPKIHDFIKNKILPPNYVFITSRKGLGEINKTYKLEPLDDNSAFILFQNMCNSPLFSIDYSKISTVKIKEFLKKTNYYPIVIKWCLSLVANKKMEFEAAFSELDKPQNALLEFIFQKLYQKLEPNSKKVLRALALYKDIPDRNIISYIAQLDSEEELMDAIYELEQHSLIRQERFDTKHGIVESIRLLGLAQTFINNITQIDANIKNKFEKRIIEIEQELDKISSETNTDFRPAQKLAQSKLLQAFKTSSIKISDRFINTLLKEAEMLAPRFYLNPFYKALIEMNKFDYEYGTVKELFIESLNLNGDDPRVLFEYGKLLKKHKRDSYKEYAPVFYKAFDKARKIGYAIEAGVAYFEAGDFNKAFQIIQKIKEIEPSFPRDNHHKYWSSQTILKLAENQILNNKQKAIELLNSVEKHIDILSEEKTKDYRLLKAKFCSLLGLSYVLSSEFLKAKEFLSTSNDIINIYKSVNRDVFEIKELLCFNYAIEALLCLDNVNKTEKLKKMENEFIGKYKKHFMVQFGALIKFIKYNKPASIS